jgi:hypothetical protein
VQACLIDSYHCTLDVAISGWEFARVSICDIELMTFLATPMSIEVPMLAFSELGRLQQVCS